MNGPPSKTLRCVNGPNTKQSCSILLIRNSRKSKSIVIENGSGTAGEPLWGLEMFSILIVVVVAVIHVHMHLSKFIKLYT